MPDISILDGPKLKAARDECAEIALPSSKNRIEKTPTKKLKLVPVDMRFIAPKHLSLFLMMCTYRIQRGRKLQSQVLADCG